MGVIGVAGVGVAGSAAPSAAGVAPVVAFTFFALRYVNVNISTKKSIFTQ